MKFIDFFSGIGGIRLGLEQAGHKCIGFCEFDKYARTSYKAMYNTEGEWENHDVRTVKPYDVPAADLWSFGFPCQDISVAGKQKGLQGGERSGLFYEIMRLLAGRRKEDRPKWLLIENVKNLLSIGNGFDFLRLLTEVGGYGYSIQWDVLNSKDFGVPQNRERVFIICYLGDIRGREIFPLRRTGGENPCQLKEITSGLSMGDRVYSTEGISKTLAGGGAKTGLYAVRFRYPERGEGSRAKGFIEPTRYGSTLTAKHCGDSTADCSNGVLISPVLTPNRIEKRQNGRRIKEPGEAAFTLTAQDRHGVALLGDNVRIRRLTPRECWRLQGFPDSYFDRAKAAGISDTQLYKQAGNSVTVNVARAIGEKLKKEVEDREKYN